MQHRRDSSIALLQRSQGKSIEGCRLSMHAAKQREVAPGRQCRSRPGTACKQVAAVCVVCTAGQRKAAAAQLWCSKHRGPISSGLHDDQCGDDTPLLPFFGWSSSQAQLPHSQPAQPQMVNSATSCGCSAPWALPVAVGAQRARVSSYRGQKMMPSQPNWMEYTHLSCPCPLEEAASPVPLPPCAACTATEAKQLPPPHSARPPSAAERGKSSVCSCKRLQ